MTGLVGLEVRSVAEGRVAVVTLNDPERRNMLSGPMVAEIVAAFDSIESDDGIGAVVVTGAGPAFCAGADLGGLAAVGGDAPAAVGDERSGALGSIYEGFLRVARCGLPTLGAVNGPAVGAGLNLALACDVRLVSPAGRFICRFGELGLHPGGGHTYLLDRLLGPQGAAAMLLFGQVLAGEEAVSRGLAWRCVPGEELLDVAVSLAGQAAAVPAALSLRMKQTLRRAASLASHEEAIALELEAQLWSLEQPFFAERLTALRSRISRPR